MKKRFKRNYQSFLQKVGKSEATIDREFDKKHRKFIELEAYAAQVHNTVKIFLQNLQNCEKVSKELSLELSGYHANSEMEQKIASIKYKNVLDDISKIINDKTTLLLETSLKPLTQLIDQMQNTKLFLKTRSRLLLEYDSAKRNLNNLERKGKNQQKIEKAKLRYDQVVKEFEVIDKKCSDIIDDFLENCSVPIKKTVKNILISYNHVIKLLVKKHSKIDTKKFLTNEKVEDILESSTTSDYSSNSTVEEKTESETSSSESDSDNIEKQNQEIKEKNKIEDEKTGSNENSSEEDKEFSIYSYFSTGVDNTKKNRKIITVEISDIESDEESTSDTDGEID
ncbi:bridging integrator 3 [Anaeramoeba flamelloides]|uniref:Bridging integrator 3 n=1 Tax=Anaeramoeba flamelloides TaxID=1746091 RepID=A0ABQ8YYB6_9EUKA|nr:bridging integrator 3 [Anaeramoeba flamelloides]